MFIFIFCYQAEKQLNSSWLLMRAGNLGVPTTSEWLNDALIPGCRIGIDPVSTTEILCCYIAVIIFTSKVWCGGVLEREGGS